VCRKNDTPTYEALITALIARLGADDELTELFLSDGGDPIRSALCLRLICAVNRLAMAESARWLTAYYPIFGGHTDPERVVPAFLDFLRANLAAVREEMRMPVQTNEVGRAAPLSAALNQVALTLDQPLHLLEVGASAVSTSSWTATSSPAATPTGDRRTHRCG